MADKRQPAFRNLLSFWVTSTADALRRSTALHMRHEHDLSLAQVRTLALIEHLQPVRLRDVAAGAGADKAQISRVVTSLVGRGYVARRSLAGDARSAHLELTEAGRAKMGAVGQSLQATDRVLRTALRAEECEQLAALLARVRKAADDLTLEEERLENRPGPTSTQAA